MTATVHEMPTAVRRCICGDGASDDIHDDDCPLFEPVSNQAAADEPAAAGGQLITLAAPLYAVEEELAIWFDTADFVTPDQEAEFLTNLARVMEATIEKRDRFIQFFSHVQAKRAHIAAEIERLTELDDTLNRAEIRAESYGVFILERRGRDERGRQPRLEGTVGTLTLRACPPSVEIRDEAVIPDAFKTVAPRMPAELWAEIMDDVNLDLRGRVVEAVGVPFAAVSRSAIKRAIDAAVDVPGADLIIGKNSLVVK